MGLIGGIGPESTLLYYKKITERVYKREKLFPPLLIESLDVYRVLLRAKGLCRPYGVFSYTGITNLAAGGAQVVAMTGNTPHIVFDELSANSPVPLVSSVAVTAGYVAMQGLKRPLLLG
ncbi:MAG: aspartate/glutamate racemase family protein, partial [Megasphaera micronuciformis]|nr:aspartate/glutamate racemase family protein [Megasphaera micronuciformis]